jgi:hypothetical protein
MSDVSGSDVSGGGGLGVSDQTMSDASLGDQMMGGDTFGGDIAPTDAGGGGFQTYSNLSTALSGGDGGAGATPVAQQSASMTPPGQAQAQASDPTGTIGGSQSGDGGDGSTQNQQQQQNQKQQQNQYAPPAAVDQLKKLLHSLSGKPLGPTGQAPQGGQNAPWAQAQQPDALARLAAGAQKPSNVQPPDMQAAAAMTAGLPEGDDTQDADGGGGSMQEARATPDATTAPPPAGTGPGGAFGDFSPGDDGLTYDPKTGTYQLPYGQPSTDAQGNPITAAGTPAAETPMPPSRPADLGQQTAQGDGGRQITVRKAGQPRPVMTTPPGTADESVPTKKGKPPTATQPAQPPSPPPAQQAPDDTVSHIPPPRLLQDIHGISLGNPAALADLARAAGMILPMMFGRHGRRGRGFGGFRGGRFTHGIGRGFGSRDGHHPGGIHTWPYHHPQHGWHMHPFHPGRGWLPLSPMDPLASSLAGVGPQDQQGQPGQQQGQPNAQGLDPNQVPPETGTAGGGSGGTGGAGGPRGLGGRPTTGGTPSSGPWSNSPFLSTMVGTESGGDNNAVGDGGLAHGVYQFHDPTWQKYAKNVPGASQYSRASQAPTDLQQAVALTTPVSEWGANTKAALHAKFGAFDEHMTVGDLNNKYGGGVNSIYGQQWTNKQPSWATKGQPLWAQPDATLPITSKPVV